MKFIERILLALLCLWLAACTEKNRPATIEEEETYPCFHSVRDSCVYPVNELLNMILGKDYAKLSPVFTEKLSDIRVDVIDYYTKDPYGKIDMGTGIISYPVQGKIKKAVLAEHPTIGASYECPSEQKLALESVLSAFGHIVISPDYLGFPSRGSALKEGSYLPHTYLHSESTAQYSIDMLLAVREYMSGIGRPLSDSVSIIGYSQGGHSALAVQKTIEAHFADSIHIYKVIAGGGPYDLVALFDEVKAGRLEPSAFVPMAIIGLDYGDALGLNYNKIFVEPLLSNYEEWINSKKHTVSEINSLIGKEFLHPDFFNGETNEETGKLHASLVKNSLIEWTPQAPVRLLHGMKDTTVPIYCSQRAYDSFKSKGCKVDLIRIPGIDHTGAVPFYIIDVITQLN